MERLGRVREAYGAAYAEPVAVRAGEELVVGAREDQWQGNPAWTWVWVTDPCGRQGWAPASVIAREGESAVAARDYDARELSVGAGEQVTVSEEESGWLWCANDRGESGWVPATHVAFEADR